MTITRIIVMRNSFNPIVPAEYARMAGMTYRDAGRFTALEGPSSAAVVVSLLGSTIRVRARPVALVPVAVPHSARVRSKSLRPPKRAPTYRMVTQVIHVVAMEMMAIGTSHLARNCRSIARNVAITIKSVQALVMRV